MAKNPPQARIYVPTKTAMQSGRGKTGRWCIDFMQTPQTYQDPLMGWTASSTTQTQLDLTFDRAEAAAYLDQQGIAYVIEPEPQENIRGKSYAENFLTH